MQDPDIEPTKGGVLTSGRLQMVYWLWPLVGAVIGYFASRRPGLSPAKCVVCGLLLGPLAVGVFFLSADRVEQAALRCPYCDQRNVSGARVCAHCSAILVSSW